MMYVWTLFCKEIFTYVSVLSEKKVDMHVWRAESKGRAQKQLESGLYAFTMS